MSYKSTVMDAVKMENDLHAMLASVIEAVKNDVQNKVPIEGVKLSKPKGSNIQTCECLFSALFRNNFVLSPRCYNPHLHAMAVGETHRTESRMKNIQSRRSEMVRKKRTPKGDTPNPSTLDILLRFMVDVKSSQQVV